MNSYICVTQSDKDGHLDCVSAYVPTRLLFERPYCIAFWKSDCIESLTFPKLFRLLCLYLRSCMKYQPLPYAFQVAAFYAKQPIYCLDNKKTRRQGSRIHFQHFFLCSARGNIFASVYMLVAIDKIYFLTSLKSVCVTFCIKIN